MNDTANTTPKCFVIMPFAKDLQEVYKYGIQPAVESAGFQCCRADDALGPRNIIREIVRNLFNADAIVADLTNSNANVFYELGVAHAISNKTVMICAKSNDQLPFDLFSYHVIFYDRTIDGIRKTLYDTLRDTLKKLNEWSDDANNPVQDFRPVQYALPLTDHADLESRLRSALAESSQLRQIPREPSQPKVARELFNDVTAWPTLLQIGQWSINGSTGVFSGSGMNCYLLSQHIYGNRPFNIRTQLSFTDLRPVSRIDAVNAGIVVGWRQSYDQLSYYHIMFTGDRLLMEAIGMRGGSEYRDFSHLDDGVPFQIEEEREYTIGVSLSHSMCDVFIDDKRLYSLVMQESPVGKVGLRPWRSRINCKHFEVYAT